VSWLTSSVQAISALDSPHHAARTIFARNVRRWEVVGRPTIACRRCPASLAEHNQLRALAQAIAQPPRGIKEAVIINSQGGELAQTRRSADPCRSGKMTAMPVPTARFKTLLAGRLDFYASKGWPQLEDVTIRWHGGYGYPHRLPARRRATAAAPVALPGLGTDWDFALYQASTETYNDTLLPNAHPTGTPEEALGLYLADPTAWIQPPTDQRVAALSRSARGCQRGCQPTQLR